VTNFGGDTVSVLDVSDRKVIGQIKTGKQPHGVAFSPDGKIVAVSNEGDSTLLSVVNAANMTVERTLSVARSPNQLSFSKNGTLLFIPSNAEHVLEVVSTRDWTIQKRIPVGRNPHVVLVSPDGSSFYVTSEGENKIVVIDGATLTPRAEIPTFGWPRIPTITKDGKTIFLTIRWLNGLIKIDTEKLKAVDWIELPRSSRFAVDGAASHGVTLAPDERSLYLTSQLADNVSVIDPATKEIRSGIAVGSNPNWVEFSADGKLGVVSNTGSNTASVVDTSPAKSLAFSRLARVRSG